MALGTPIFGTSKKKKTTSSAPTSVSTTGTSGNAFGVTDPYDAHLAKMQSASDRLDRGRHMEIAAQQAVDAARKGINITMEGMGAYGPYSISAPGATTAAKSSASSGSRSSGSGVDYMLDDVSMSDYRQALSEMPSVPARVAPISMLDRSAAEAAAYGRARDAVGSEARGAATSLADEMSALGLSGAGLEGALLGNILTKGQGELGEVNRELAIDRMRRADAVQDTNYQGSIQQRGQDIGANEARVSNAMRLAELLRRRRRVTV